MSIWITVLGGVSETGEDKAGEKRKGFFLNYTENEMIQHIGNQGKVLPAAITPQKSTKTYKA